MFEYRRPAFWTAIFCVFVCLCSDHSEGSDSEGSSSNDSSSSSHHKKHQKRMLDDFFETQFKKRRRVRHKTHNYIILKKFSLF